MILEEYASWLKENRLQEVAAKNLEIARKMDVPLLKLFEHMPEDKLVALCRQNLSDFLEGISHGKAWDQLKDSMQAWEENTLEYNISQHSIQPSDIILANNAQSRAVITFIPEFTKDSAIAIEIVNEFSAYYSKAQKLGFETLIRIREKSEESFHSLVSSIREVAIFRLDTKGYIQTWNPGAQRLKGYTEDEIIGRHFSIFYSKEDVEDGKPERELEIAAAEGKYEEEGWRLRKYGSHFWAQVVITPIYETEGRLIGFAKVTQDLTQRLQYERSLMRKNQELSRYISDISQFARVTAHELKEPLHVISTFVKMLQKNYQDEQNPDAAVSKYRATILAKTSLMRRQLDAMQEYMGLGIVKEEAVPTDLNVIMEQAKISLSKEIEGTGALIECGHLPIVPFARFHMLTLFRNLLENALKFHSKQQSPKIEIAAKREGPMWLFSVKDNAIEIEPAHREKIFEMFSKLNPRDPASGIGMGLTTCKKIVELNGGKIWVEANPSGGNIFFFTLPAETTNKKQKIPD